MANDPNKPGYVRGVNSPLITWPLISRLVDGKFNSSRGRNDRGVGALKKREVAFI